MSTTLVDPPAPATRADDPSSRRRSLVSLSFGAVGAYLVIAFLLYQHSALSGGTAFPDCACGDQVQEVWFLRWPLYSLVHWTNPLFTTFMNAPHGVNLAINTSAPLLGVLSIPLQVTVGPAAAYLLLLPLTMAASAASLFFVLRRWIPSPWIRFPAGLLYGFSPFMIGQGEGHAFLTAAFVPPLVLLALDDLLGGRRSSRRAGLTLGALLVAQYLISPEVLAMTVVLGAVGVLVLAVANPARTRDRIGPVARGLGYAAVLAGVLLAYPVWFALAGPQHVSGPPHSVADLNRFSGDLLGAIVPTVFERLGPTSLKARGDLFTAGSPVENGLYVGIPLVVLAVALTVRFRRHRPLWFFGAMTVGAWILALGSRATVDGHRSSVPLPFAGLLHLPLVNDIASVRFSLFVQLFAACWLAFGVHALATDRHAHTPARRGAVARRVKVLPVLVVVVALTPLVPARAYSVGPADVPTFYRDGGTAIRPGSVALAYPYPGAATPQAMLNQVTTGLRYRIVGGYAFVPAADGASTLAAPLLAPASVQTFLIQAYAPVPGAPRVTVNAATVADLRTFLVRYGIGSVLVDPVGDDPRAVVRLVTAAIGPGVRRGGTTVWLDVPARLALVLAADGRTR